MRRRLSLADAVVIGVGSMVGAGVFAVWGPAAEAAGGWLLLALALAGAVAFCNATSSAQLAAVHPESGGTYVYGRARLGPGWGHLAGWGFVVGKTASCAAMALTVGAYLWPAQQRAVAVAAVVLIVAVNLRGVTRTVAITRVLITVSLLALAAVVAAGLAAAVTAADGGSAAGAAVPLQAATGTASPVTAAGVLQAAGLMFFAFAGYARIATMGEEVVDPATTIPRAIPRALAGVLVLYAVVGGTALLAVGAEGLAGRDAPLAAVVEAGPLAALRPLVAVGAGIAALGVLLNLLAGISRTALAMARRGELPRPLARISPAHDVPATAELVVAVAVVLLVVVVDLRNAIGLSGVAVLTYYAITNAAALRLSPDERRWPRWIAWTGLIGCIVLAASLPPLAVATGTAVLLAGALVRALIRPPA